MNCYIGIDIGTSGTKTVLFDAQGNTMTSSTVEYQMAQPKNGWAEQDPLDWWNAVCITTKDVISKSGIKNEQIKGVGLSGQMHGLVMLDKDDKILIIPRPSESCCMKSKTSSAGSPKNSSPPSSSRTNKPRWIAPILALEILPNSVV